MFPFSGSRFARAQRERLDENAEESSHTSLNRQSLAARYEVHALASKIFHNPVRKPTPAAAEREHPQVMTLKRTVLYQRQKPMLCAARIESVYDVEDAHGTRGSTSQAVTRD